MFKPTALDFCGDSRRRIDLGDQPVVRPTSFSCEAAIRLGSCAYRTQLFQQHEGHVVAIFWAEIAKETHFDVALIWSGRVVSPV